MEVSEKLPAADRSAICHARAAAVTDGQRLRAWIEIHLNRNSLCSQLETLSDDRALLTMMYSAEALLARTEARSLLFDTLRPLDNLSFCLRYPAPA